jgi:catechol-2,3-dioxygenase
MIQVGVGIRSVDIVAAFYAAILGMRINEDSEDWVVIDSEPGERRLAFRRSWA